MSRIFRVDGVESVKIANKHLSTNVAKENWKFTLSYKDNDIIGYFIIEDENDCMLFKLTVDKAFLVDFIQPLV